MKAPPLKLWHNFFRKIVVAENPNFSPSDAQAGIAPDADCVKFAVRIYDQQDGDTHWTASLSISINDSDQLHPPYLIQTEVLGVFSIDDQDPLDKKHEKLVAITGGSILYSAAREYIATISSRLTHGPFFLPTVSLLGLTKNSTLEDSVDDKASKKSNT